MALRTAYRLAVVLAIVTSACAESSPAPREDATAGDASDSSILSVPEAGVDASGVDASDAGFVPDSGSSDAGLADGDGPFDASLPVDSGTPDADLIDAGSIDSGSGPIASDLALTIDRDIDPAPTPINLLYLSEIEATVAGDRIALLQKYFHNVAITTALVDAARRGVEVIGVYGDDVDPTCESLLQAGDTIDCGTMFVRSIQAHHKNMMILKADGHARGIVGSYNLRERSTDSPRVHTVLSFDVENGAPVFDYYLGEVDRLTFGTTTQPKTLSVPIAGGGTLDFTFHPHTTNPVLDLLNGISTCDGVLWMSYFGALADSIGRPVFDRLSDLFAAGCDVRVLLDPGATLAQLSLSARNVPVEFPTFPYGDGTLGHKIVLVSTNGETHLIQTSANLSSAHYNIMHNLTVRVRAPALSFAAAIDAELSRYW